MKSDAMSKLSASFVVLVMALSALVFMPVGSDVQATSAANIYVPVVSSGSSVLGAKVNLTDVHTGAVTAATYSAFKPAYVVSNAPSGYYRVDVTHDDYYDRLGVAEFRFSALTNYTVTPVQLTAFPYKDHTWNVTVRDPSNRILTGALVGFYDPVNKEFVSKGYTNALGWVAVPMFTTAVLGDVELVIVRNGFVTYVNPVLVNSDQTMTVNLAKSKVVSSYVTHNGEPATNTVAYLINTDPAVSWVKRVLRSSSSAMAFDAYAGNFTLVVDADGAAAHVQAVTVAASDVELTIALGNQTQRTEQVTMTYGANFRSFSMSVGTNWSYDDAYPGLMYNDMGSLRMQVDLMLGNGDGTLSVGEVGSFYNKVRNYGSQYVTSSRLLTVNDTAYVSDLSVTGYVMDLASGSVVSTAGVNYGYSCGYIANTIDLGAKEYNAVGYARYDTGAVNYRYTVALVNAYELVANSSSSNVVVTGYLTFTLDPKKAAGGPEAVGLSFEMSDGPVAKVGMDASSVVYIVRNATGVITKYIVKVGANATFSSADSDDPNGNPLTFVWDFGDSVGTATTKEDTTVYMYTTAAASRTVNVTVEDVAGLLNWTDFEVVCDDLDPTPRISVKTLTINTTDNSIMTNQRDVVAFNATTSTDDVASAGDGLGIIDWVEFDFGDGNKSGRIPRTQAEQNATHAYARAGVHTVVLNVTDVVGHWKNTTLTVRVNDTSKPTASYVVKNATWGTNLVENNTLYFDANATVDNLDEKANLTYSWYFGDGTWQNGTGLDYVNVTHSYARIGSLTTSLNVTDTAGNWYKASKVVTIASGPRPNMRIDRVYYDPGNFTEGQRGYIIVNMTNAGSAVANNVVVTFYMVNPDGSQKLLGTWTELLNGSQTVTTVQVGGKVQVTFPYTFNSKGTYTIKVNVTSANQLNPHVYTASGDNALVVKEAGWKKIALWGGVAAVIVLIPLLLYLRGRWAKREKRGPRRERPAKERPAEKEEEL